jgi:hypothetical protein
VGQFPAILPLLGPIAGGQAIDQQLREPTIQSSMKNL